jgi:hypothetical protein
VLKFDDDAIATVTFEAVDGTVPEPAALTLLAFGLTGCNSCGDLSAEGRRVSTLIRCVNTVQLATEPLRRRCKVCKLTATMATNADHPRRPASEDSPYHAEERADRVEQMLTRAVRAVKKDDRPLVPVRSNKEKPHRVR